MINLKLMYELYTLHLKLKFKILAKRLKINTALKDNLVEVLNNNKDIIDFYLNKNLTTILKYNSKEQLKDINYPIVKVYYKGKELNFKAIALYIERYVYINNKCSSIKRDIRNIEKQIISFKLYRLIIKKGNSKIMDLILNDNFAFTPLKSFGTIGIIKNKSKRVSFNWGESLKNKKALLEEGKIPYKKADAEKIENYQGVKWLVKNPEIDFFFHWFKCNPLIKYAPRLKYIMFEPARGRASIVSKLASKKADREFAFKTYTNTLSSYEGI